MEAWRFFTLLFWCEYFASSSVCAERNLVMGRVKGKEDFSLSSRISRVTSYDAKGNLERVSKSDVKHSIHGDVVRGPMRPSVYSIFFSVKFLL